MNYIQFAFDLDELIQAGPNIFVTLDPEIVDFTVGESFKLVLHSKSKVLPVEVTDETIIEVLGFLRTALLENKAVNLIGWNLKNLFTTVLFKTGTRLDCDCKLLDLKIAEAFIGIKEKAPANFAEVQIRVKRLLTDSSWNKFKKLYQSVYSPLIDEVMPSLEVTGVFDYMNRKLLFPYYEIEGQVGGRSVCSLAYKHCFNPHSLSVDQKLSLKPKGTELTFLIFDFRYMEACMLSWLCGDERLRNLLSQEEDFYKLLFNLLEDAKGDVSEENRTFTKGLFLPVVYGQQAKSLAESHKIKADKAKFVIDKLHYLFPKVFKWVEDYQKDGLAYEDYFGRKRFLSKEEEYKYRGFIVQSPAALVCLEKLIALHKEIKGYARVVAHIHDGYVVAAEEKQANMVSSICLKALETESELCPGLKLKVKHKISKTLA